MQAVLSFDVRVETTSCDFGRQHWAELVVTPLFNGVALYAAGAEDVFDAVATLVRGVSSGPFTPFTCRCGSPQCAGVFDDVQLVLQGGAVVWRFPPRSFRQRLLMGDGVDKMALEVSFERAQYEQSLARLERSLDRYLSKLDLPCTVAPYGRLGVIERAPSLSALVQRYRAGLEGKRPAGGHLVPPSG